MFPLGEPPICNEGSPRVGDLALDVVRKIAELEGVSRSVLRCHANGYVRFGGLEVDLRHGAAPGRAMHDHRADTLALE